MTAARHFVVVGASQAGLACATALRTLGFDGQITMVGDEPHPPYSRPPLSKGVLVGSESEGSIFLPAADGVDLVTGISAVGLDRYRNILELSTGDGIRYDGLVIATGARARRLGQAPEGEVTLRSLDDVRALRELLVSARDVAVAGGGFLGMEVAASAVALGKSVTIVDRVRPLIDRLGPVLSDILLTAAAESGVKVRVAAAGVGVGFDSERPHRIVSADGATLAEADLVITAAGDVPNTEWLRDSGVRVDGGVVVDNHCRVAPGIVAAGDVVTLDAGAGLRARTPHWWNALSQAKVAAAALLGREPDTATQTTPPFFWTEAFGLHIRLAGHLPPIGEPTVVAGSLADRRVLLAWPPPALGTGFGTAAALNYHVSAPKLTRLASQPLTQ
jgi:NADPH-dependent 2,4-dienoyl-CoA reductase/sulfur reductase-like enzyme